MPFVECLEASLRRVIPYGPGGEELAPVRRVCFCHLSGVAFGGSSRSGVHGISPVRSHRGIYPMGRRSRCPPAVEGEGACVVCLASVVCHAFQARV